MTPTRLAEMTRDYGGRLVSGPGAEEWMVDFVRDMDTSLKELLTAVTEAHEELVRSHQNAVDLVKERDALQRQVDELKARNQDAMAALNSSAILLTRVVEAKAALRGEEAR